tara:strand:+ start:1332 stop:1880 length:549 start_codon:yes stop_codon:yes gene_type:complete
MGRKTLAERRARDAAKEADMSIGERIFDRAKNTPKRLLSGIDADWYANELYNELSEVAEERFPEIGELCYFSYSAAYANKYQWWDRRPLAYILDIRNDSILGGNLHYYNPNIRSAIAGSLINKREAQLPNKTLHRYFINNISGLYIIPEDSKEWSDIAMLVTESFVNKYGRKVSPEQVWDST